MANRARVNPAREAPADPAPEGGPRVTEEDERSVSGFIIENVSRLYGYALLISGFDSLFLSGVASLPLTKWNSTGVPRADVVAVSVSRARRDTL